MPKYEYNGEFLYRYNCIVEADTEEEALEKAEELAEKFAEYEDTTFYDISETEADCYE